MTPAAWSIPALILAGAWAIPALAGDPESAAPGWAHDPRSGCAAWCRTPLPRAAVAWSGECADGLAAGSGVLQWFQDGREIARYAGEMQAGKGAGHGAGVLMTGERYAGEWRADLRAGHGESLYLDGERYAGAWSNDQRHGAGVYTWPDGESYAGEWQQDDREGHGVLLFPDGRQYAGDIRRGRIAGLGHFAFPDGGHCAGHFAEGAADGWAVFQWADDDYYAGQWVNGQRHGLGLRHYPDGTEEGGPWVNDQFAGVPDAPATNLAAVTDMARSMAAQAMETAQAARRAAAAAQAAAELAWLAGAQARQVAATLGDTPAETSVAALPAVAPAAPLTPDAAAPAPDSLPPWRGARSTFAMADLAPYGMETAETAILSQVLRNALQDTGYFEIISRGQMETILEDTASPAATACNETQCLVDMGRRLAVRTIAGGSIGRVGGIFSVSLRLVNVETGEIEATVDRDIDGAPEDLPDALRGLGRSLAGKYAGLRLKNAQP